MSFEGTSPTLDAHRHSFHVKYTFYCVFQIISFFFCFSAVSTSFHHCRMLCASVLCLWGLVRCLNQFVWLFPWKSRQCHLFGFLIHHCLPTRHFKSITIAYHYHAHWETKKRQLNIGNPIIKDSQHVKSVQLCNVSMFFKYDFKSNICLLFRRGGRLCWHCWPR